MLRIWELIGVTIELDVHRILAALETGSVSIELWWCKEVLCIYGGVGSGWGQIGQCKIKGEYSGLFMVEVIAERGHFFLQESESSFAAWSRLCVSASTD